jgi:hypothetical protein
MGQAKTLGIYEGGMKMKVPIDKDGNMCSFCPAWTKRVKMIELDDFEDELTYSGYSRGRSSVRFSFIDSHGRHFPMFLSEFSKVVAMMEGGMISGIWTAKKRGVNYSITLKECQNED